MILVLPLHGTFPSLYTQFISPFRSHLIAIPHISSDQASACREWGEGE